MTKQNDFVKWPPRSAWEQPPSAGLMSQGAEALQPLFFGFSECSSPLNTRPNEKPSGELSRCHFSGPCSKCTTCCSSTFLSGQQKRNKLRKAVGEMVLNHRDSPLPTPSLLPTSAIQVAFSVLGNISSKIQPGEMSLIQTQKSGTETISM